eukprot:294222_1
MYVLYLLCAAENDEVDEFVEDTHPIEVEMNENDGHKEEPMRMRQVVVNKSKSDIYANRIELFDEALRNLSLDEFLKRFQIRKINSDKPELVPRSSNKFVVVSYYPFIKISNKKMETQLLRRFLHENRQ